MWSGDDDSAPHQISLGLVPIGILGKIGQPTRETLKWISESGHTVRDISPARFLIKIKLGHIFYIFEEKC